MTAVRILRMPGFTSISEVNISESLSSIYRNATLIVFVREQAEKDIDHALLLVEIGPCNLPSLPPVPRRSLAGAMPGTDQTS